MDGKDAKNLKETIEEDVLPKLKKALGISLNISDQDESSTTNLYIYIAESTKRLRNEVNESPSLQRLLQQVIITPVVRKQTYDKEDIGHTNKLQSDEESFDHKPIANKITKLLKSPFKGSSYTDNRADLFPSEVFASYYKTPQKRFYYDFKEMVNSGHGNPVAAIAAHFFTSEFLGKKLIDQNDNGTAGILDAGAVIYGLVADHLLKSRIVSVYPESDRKSSVLAETRANLIAASHFDSKTEDKNTSGVIPYYIGMRQLIETYGNAKHRKKDIDNLHKDMKELLNLEATEGGYEPYYNNLYDKYSAALISDKVKDTEVESKLADIIALKNDEKYSKAPIKEFITSLEKMIDDWGTATVKNALKTFLDKALDLIKSCVVEDDEKFKLFFSSSITDKGEEMVVEEGALALETTPKIEEKQPSLPWIMHGCGHDDMFQDHSLMETSARIWNEDVMVV
jgi:hypothetical protein